MSLIQLSFNYILYNNGCVRLKTCIHFINYWKQNGDASPENKKSIPPVWHYVYYKDGHFATIGFTPTDLLVHSAAKLSIPTSK